MLETCERHLGALPEQGWNLASSQNLCQQVLGLDPCLSPSLLWDRRWLTRCVETVATALMEVVDPSGLSSDILSSWTNFLFLSIRGRD